MLLHTFIKNFLVNKMHLLPLFRPRDIPWAKKLSRVPGTNFLKTISVLLSRGKLKPCRPYEPFYICPEFWKLKNRGTYLVYAQVARSF